MDSIPEEGSQYTDRASDEDFERRVAQELHELLGLVLGILEMSFDQAIQDRGLLAGVAPQAGRVIHDDETEVERDSEQGGCETFLQSDRGAQGRDRGRVGTGHPPRLDESSQIPVPGPEIVGETFVGLYREATEQGDPEWFRDVLLADP